MVGLFEIFCNNFLKIIFLVYVSYNGSAAYCKFGLGLVFDNFALFLK